MVIKFLRGTGRVPPVRGGPGRVGLEGSLDVSYCCIPNVYPERSEGLGEVRRAEVAADDVSDLAVGVV